MVVNNEQANNMEDVLGWQNTDLLKTIESLEHDGDMKGAQELRAKIGKGVARLNVLEDLDLTYVEVIKGLNEEPARI